MVPFRQFAIMHHLRCQGSMASGGLLVSHQRPGPLRLFYMPSVICIIAGLTLVKRTPVKEACSYSCIANSST